MSTTPMTPERLDAIRERVSETSWNTDRAWKVWDDGITRAVYFDTPGGGAEFVCDHFPYGQHQGEADATFIAHAPEDIADLLAEVERLRALTTVDETMVVRAAETLFLREFLRDNEWADEARARVSLSAVRDMGSGWQVKLYDARAALNAALGTGEGA